MKISIKKYPYEMYCTGCNTTLAYLNYQAKQGRILKSKGVIELDGKPAETGTAIKNCKCTGTTFLRSYWTRKRKPLISEG